MEEARGVKGYKETQAELETISVKASQVNEKKAKNLEEISRIVNDINTSIKVHLAMKNGR